MPRAKKIDADDVSVYLQGRLESKGLPAVLKEMQQLQVAAYVMCGGGFLGRSIADQPDAFYIDARCGKLPYSVREIYNVRDTLIRYRVTLNLDKMPPLEFDSHNCGVW